MLWSLDTNKYLSSVRESGFKLGKMKSIYFDPNIPRILLTRLLGSHNKQIYYSPFAPVSFRELKTHELPGPGWVRTRNRLAGNCGSDVSISF